MATPADFSYEEIGPLIRVYKNLLPNTNGITKTLDKMVEINSGEYFYSKWEQWFVFGKYSHLRFILSDDIPKIDTNLTAELVVFKQVQESTRIAIAHYVAHNEVPVPPNSLMTDVSLAYYEDGIDISSDKCNMAMTPHSDYVIPEDGWPGEKFLITATTYVNDNYEGGEIYFLFDNERLVYKPEAGDIIVFPSGSPVWPNSSPYYHGVNTPYNGRKYLLRCYLKYITEASQEYLDGVKEHGEERWKQICKETKLSCPPTRQEYIQK